MVHLFRWETLSEKKSYDELPGLAWTKTSVSTVERERGDFLRDAGPQARYVPGPTMIMPVNFGDSGGRRFDHRTIVGN